jgi:hypothetical protein
MAEAFQVTVKGLDLLTVKLLKFAEDVENANIFSSDIGSEIVKNASAIVPKRTGALAASLGHTKTAKGVQVYAGNEAVPYAGVIEYGWPAKGKPEQPYLRPAVYDNLSSLIKKYEDGIEKTIIKYNLD